MDINNQLPLNEAKEVFQIVYGRAPSQSELDHITSLLASHDHINPVALFRAIVNGIDHQQNNTPFTIRLSNDDVEFVNIAGVEIAIDWTDIAVSIPLRTGTYEPHLTGFYSQMLKPGMTFVDVGANIGVYSLLGARLVGDHGHVLSFEPNSENCRLLMLSALRNNFQNISVYPFALGENVGHVLFSTAIGSNGCLLPDKQESLTNTSCMVVPMIRLDDVVDTKVDMIKMDVEGAEGLVAKGAKNIIEKYRPIITTEFSIEMLPRISGISGLEYLRFFTEMGYKVFLFEPDSREPVHIPNIDLFLRDYGELTRIENLAFLPE